jgi:hypothetical protein
MCEMHSSYDSVGTKVPLSFRFRFKPQAVHTWDGTDVANVKVGSRGHLSGTMKRSDLTDIYFARKLSLTLQMDIAHFLREVQVTFFK